MASLLWNVSALLVGAVLASTESQSSLVCIINLICTHLWNNTTTEIIFLRECVIQTAAAIKRSLLNESKRNLLRKIHLRTDPNRGCVKATCVCR